MPSFKTHTIRSNLVRIRVLKLHAKVKKLCRVLTLHAEFKNFLEGEAHGFFLLLVLYLKKKELTEPSKKFVCTLLALPRYPQRLEQLAQIAKLARVKLAKTLCSSKAS